MVPQQLRVMAPAVDLEVLTWGNPGAPVAVLLHGFPDSAWTWEQLAPMLADQGWYVVAPFTRGYAPSSLAYDDDYSLGSLVSDVVTVYRAVDGDGRAVIVGHDWGGAIASAVASTHPEMFSRAVLIAIPPLAAIKGLAHPGRLWSALPVLVRQLPRSWYMPVLSVPRISDSKGELLINRLWRLWAPAAEVDRYRQQGLEALGTRARRRAAFSYYRAVWNPFYRRAKNHRDIQRHAFGSPRIPTLYLQGADDTCGLEATGARAEEHMPSGSRRVVVSGAGHFAHLERPEVITSHILDYITKDPAHETV
ncbi:alpha/beta fold hydrolase [Mycobacteroides abscessus]|uniref:alpha/beta fold hydrolase n=1 Tax=Mycobacteroides abscessus TaxID=36809 RepID=UPI000D3E3EA5|nr:alpha/beta hydrolase [Mycobacteroides abscessus]PVB25945.1 alpha/beta hydrolase [Mycobacteroides abscessus]